MLLDRPIVLHRKDALQPAEAGYWKDLLYRVIKIGTELEVAPKKNCDRPTFETVVCELLPPSKSLELQRANDVLDMSSERGGFEINEYVDQLWEAIPR
jgi:hypothetical protein